MLFNIYLKQTFAKWYRKYFGMEKWIDNDMLHSLLFADGQIFFAHDQEDKEYSRNLTEEYEKYTLHIIYTIRQNLCIGR